MKSGSANANQKYSGLNVLIVRSDLLKSRAIAIEMPIFLIDGIEKIFNERIIIASMFKLKKISLVNLIF